MNDPENPKPDSTPSEDAEEGDVEELLGGAMPIKPLDDNNNNKNNYTKPK